jgi:protocatechuate 3,4-dioxygenase beta subunit
MIAEIAEGASVPQVSGATDPAGRFTFRNLAPGQYMVRAQRDGYFGATPGVVGTFGTLVTSPATVVAGGMPTEVALRMVRGATISGRVRDAKGQPVPNLNVATYQIGYRDGRETLNAGTAKATDDRGEFRIFWVAPGEYYVAAAPFIDRVALAAAAVAAGMTIPPRQESLPRTFHPSAADARSASRLTISEGAEVTGIDITVSPAATVKVTGRIVNSVSPQGVRATNFYLLPRDPDALSDTAVIPFANSSTAPGEFEIRGVAPGSYDLVTTVPDANGRQYPGRTVIEVGARDLEGVILSIHPGVEVKARVLIDGQLVAASGGRGIRALLRSKEVYPAPFDTYVSNGAIIDEAGVCVFPSVPEGSYSITVTGMPNNSFVADIREGGRSIYDSGIVINDRPPGPIDVMVNSGAQSIRGTVRDAQGKPAPTATVVVVPPAARRQNALLYKTYRTNFNGEFLLNNVAPGEYKLFAWESLPNSAYLNPSFMARYESLGQAVTIAAGGNLNFDLKLIPGADPN